MKRTILKEHSLRKIRIDRKAGISNNSKEPNNSIIEITLKTAIITHGAAP